ncbi:hypothetical protein BDW_14050 [Bdellovibrio bacteriovorus W]|nr:hypothetical protein BDW_14050 [Bdellovibrio bacteriovorus W]
MYNYILALCFLFLVGCISWGDKNKQTADLHLRLGTSQIESGSYPAALQELLKAEELDPKNPVIQNNLGLVYFFRERYDLSEKHLRIALKLNSKYSEARNNLSRVLIEKGQFKEAEQEANKVINDLTYPNPNKAYINLGLAQFHQKNFMGSRISFEKVLDSTPDDCVASTYYGRTFFETRDYSRATETLDQAIGFCQRLMYDEPHYYSALAYYREGNRSRSQARFEELVKFYPNGKYREKAKGMLGLLRKGH